jgi:hypothetical protein
MRELNSDEIGFVNGCGAGDIEVEIGTGGVSMKGSLADFGDLAVQYSRIAPFSGIGMVGIVIKYMQR